MFIYQETGSLSMFNNILSHKQFPFLKTKYNDDCITVKQVMVICDNIQRKLQFINKEKLPQPTLKLRSI